MNYRSTSGFSSGIVSDLMVPCDDDDLAESQYSRLANEAHALRLENEKLRDAIKTIECAIEAARVV